VTRVRFRFAKLGKVRWTSHRDMARMWERAFRRIELPLAYSQGFSPRPKVSFGLALPTGAESVSEFLDVELAPGADADLPALPGRLSPALPVGVEVTAAGRLVDGGGSLQSEVTSCCWVVTVPGLDPGELAAAVDRALAAAALVIGRERKGRLTEDDIRPGIVALESIDDATLVCELATMPRALRPTELLLALGLEPSHAGIRRISQWIERDGARWEPLAAPAGATGAPHAAGCAS